MLLTLTITSSKNAVAEQKMVCVFKEKGGTIGRKLSNTWVLPDEFRHLSGSHASIEYVSGKYYITDTSTNGVYMNGNSKPLGRGNRQQLENGFQLLMGTYNFSIELSEEAGTSDELVTNSSGDLFLDLLEEPDASTNGRLPDASFDDSIAEETSKPLNIGSDDPFFDFGTFSSIDKSNSVKSKSREQDEHLVIDNFFKPQKIKKQSNKKGSNRESSDIEIEENSTDNNDPSEIPDDWITAESKKNSIDELLSGIGDPLAPIKIDKKLVGKSKLKKRESKKNNKVDMAVEIGNINSSLMATGNLDAFYKGLGLDNKAFQEQLTEEDLFLAGKLFRVAVQGTMEVLQSRAEIKNEMRMDMTTIRPIQNNPIKFALSTDEAINKLFIQKNQSYMAPEKAMEEAYDDIKSHQVAVISGIQASLSSVLRRFKPENLIERLEKESPISANIPIHRKAKLWEEFEELYETIQIEAEDDFNRLFGQEFAKAYEEQVALLKKKRREMT